MFRNIVILASGTMFAQAIIFATMPLITRLFGPEAIGQLGTFTAIAEIIIPIAALTYPIAIVLPKRETEALDIANLSVFISLIMSVISIVLISILKIFDAFEDINLTLYLILIPLVILGAACLQIIEQWMIRNKEFSLSAKAAVYHSILMNGGKVGLGFINPIAGGLITIQSANSGSKALIMYLLSKKKIKFNLRINSENAKNILNVAKQHNDFPKYRSPQMLLNAMSQSIPVLLLMSFVGPVAVGYYTIARTALNAPIQLLGKSIGDVFYPRITEAYHKGEDMYGLIKKATLVLAVIGLVPFGIIIFFGPAIFELVFGEGWNVAGTYASWLSLWLFFLFINNPAVRSLPVLKAQKFHLNFTIISLITRISGMLIGFLLFNNEIVAIAIFSITGAVLNIFLIIVTLNISRKSRS